MKLLGKIVGGIFGRSLFFIFIANRGNSGVIDDTYDYQYDATADTTCVTVDKDGDKTVMRRIK